MFLKHSNVKKLTGIHPAGPLGPTPTRQFAHSVIVGRQPRNVPQPGPIDEQAGTHRAQESTVMPSLARHKANWSPIATEVQAGPPVIIVPKGIEASSLTLYDRILASFGPSMGSFHKTSEAAASEAISVIAGGSDDSKVKCAGSSNSRTSILWAVEFPTFSTRIK